MPNNILFILVVVLTIVVCCLAIWIIGIVNANKKVIENLTESISSNYNNYKNELKEQNNILVNQLIEQTSTQYEKMMSGIGDKTEKALFNTFLKLRSAIKENCIATMNTIKADRIAIYLLHNGTFSTHGISFFKMSCICEKVSIGCGVRERMLEHTNIPINLFDDMIEKLIINNRYIIINSDDISNTNHKIFISADKIKYTQLVAIYDINNNMLGFVAAEMEHPYSKDSADKEKESLDTLVRQLVPVLSYADYTSLKAQ